MAKCKLCGVNKAVVPDRESNSSRLAICKVCHGKRLRGDLKTILSRTRRGRHI